MSDPDSTDAIINVYSTDIVIKGASTSAGFGCSSSLNIEAKQRSQQQPNVSELF